MASAPNIDLVLLPEESIVACVKDFTGIPFSANDLKNPKYEKLYPVYSAFICNILEVSNEQIMQAPIHVMETITHPELNVAEGVGKLMFIKVLEHFFQVACKIQDFSMNDLMSPTRKRTRRLLSAIVNYAQFVISNSTVRTNILEKIDSLNKNQESLKTKRDSLKATLHTLKMEKIRKQKAVQEMNLDELRAQNHDIVAERQIKEADDANVSAQVEELNNILTITHAAKLKKQANEVVKDHMSRGRDLAVKEKFLTEFSEDTPAALKLIQSVEADLNQRRKVGNEMEYLRDQSQEQSVCLKNLTADIQNTLRQLKSRQDKLQRLVSQYDHKMGLVEEADSAMESEQAVFFAEFQLQSKELTNMESELKALAEFRVVKSDEHKAKMELMQSKCDSACSMLKQYHEKLSQANVRINAAVCNMEKRLT